ncbi:MAG: polyketide synthase, partial [Candidatus Eremiobacteraeota bacterium]|nr:polyketide synthase [Candidatus Eremiobacteraeota bacterium]
PTLEGNLTGQAKTPPRLVHPANLDVVSLPAALVARCLNLGGASLTLDAACASSLYAIKLACDELEAGRADAMLAGGVSRPDCLYTQMGFTALGALSPSGHCSPFDLKGDGLVVGEGAGVVVLKRLEDALRDGDTIYGLLRGIGLSNDLGGSLLAPSHEGQLRAMRDAYAEAGWRPNQVELVECHGTGTPMGDRIEIESLRTLWENEPFKPGQCSLGSVKSMIGHLLTAAGAAGLIKVLMALRDKVLPPMINFTQPGKGISLEGGPFKVQTQPEEWVDPGHPRRAAVSAFGFGGINAHVLVEEWVGQKAAPVKEEAPEPVAIVAVASRFGKLKTQHQFMQTVFSGGSAVEARPAMRWNGNPLAAIDTPGAYIDRLEIPVGKFRLPPSDIPSSLPQQLLMLEVAAQAAEQAGLKREPKARAGAIIGINLDPDTTNFHLRWAVDALIEQWGAEATAEEREKLRQSASPVLDSTRTLGALGSIVASRLARELAVGGPSFAISAGEASGIRALEVAVRALQRGELETCLVGAVDLAGDPRSVLAAHKRRRLAADGKVKPFGAGTGSAVGEGAVALVVKRLADAERDGDQVLAVVRGMGAGSGAAAYQLALERAYSEAGVEPGQVSLLEAAATGDPDEDAYEAAELGRFFGTGLPLAVGSVTPFVGQTGAVAGLASLAKAVGCLQESLLPPLPGFEGPAQGWPEHIHFPRQASFWYRNRQDGPRLA